MSVEVLPVTADRWQDLVDLFERRGPRGGHPVTDACWCMFWRLEPAEFRRGAQWTDPVLRGAGNKTALHELVSQGRVPGVLAYLNGEPVGWCSIAPREEFVRLEASKPLARVDDQPVWSVVCFYIDKRNQRQGVGLELLQAAVEYARTQGARLVEGYPSKPGDDDPYTGLESMFAAAGFEQVRTGRRRGIWRRRV